MTTGRIAIGIYVWIAFLQKVKMQYARNLDSLDCSPKARLKLTTSYILYLDTSGKPISTVKDLKMRRRAAVTRQHWNCALLATCLQLWSSVTIHPSAGQPAFLIEGHCHEFVTAVVRFAGQPRSVLISLTSLARSCFRAER